MFFFKKKQQVQDVAKIDLANIPTHVAFIMDGNGRWAKSRRLPVSVGHTKGVERVEDTIEMGKELGIKYMSFYAFSTENWKRDKDEIDHLFGLIHTFYKMKFPKLLKENICLKFIGTRKDIPEDLIEKIEKMELESANNNAMTVNIAFNYGGRLELVEACNQLIAQGKKEISEDDIAANLYTKNQPDVDLMIRTSGEKRISNFLIWQLSYAEFLFPEIYWPDFTKEELKKNIIEYQNRDRRFGGR